MGIRDKQQMKAMWVRNLVEKTWKSCWGGLDENEVYEGQTTG